VFPGRLVGIEALVDLFDAQRARARAGRGPGDPRLLGAGRAPGVSGASRARGHGRARGGGRGPVRRWCGVLTRPRRWSRRPRPAGCRGLRRWPRGCWLRGCCPGGCRGPRCWPRGCWPAGCRGLRCWPRGCCPGGCRGPRCWSGGCRPGGCRGRRLRRLSPAQQPAERARAAGRAVPAARLATRRIRLARPRRGGQIHSVRTCMRGVVVSGDGARICHVGYLLIGDLSGVLSATWAACCRNLS
jgi:hypothetical protein